MNDIARRHPRLPQDAFEAPPDHLPTLREVRDAYRAGRPISQDRRHWSGRVYFAEDKARGLLKIGLSNDVAKRIAALCQHARSEVVLIGDIAGNRQEELRHQEAFHKWRFAGEWFVLTDDCRAAVRAIFAPKPEISQ